MNLKRISLFLSVSLLTAVASMGMTAPLAFAKNATSIDEQSAALPADAPGAVSSVEALGPPSDVWERIRRGYGMPVLQNALVDKWIRFYTKDPQYLNRMFTRSSQYLYHIIEEVESRGMPTELALLPFVESAFQPEALSRAKAAGLWQFMPQTGKNYSLEQNLWRDDRRDVMESTRAALDYFEYLYGMFNDWHLALAAYNWGEGSVQRAIKRQKSLKRPTDYEHLRMPRETANYVPKLEAIKRIVSDPKKYGLTLPDVGNEPFFVSITKPRDIDVETAARLADMSLPEFKKLNPSFKLPVIVASHNNVMLLPADKLDTFVDNLASWMDTGQPLSQWRTHKLKAGETLAQVAEDAGMTEAELRRVNGIPAGRKVLANSTLLVKSDGEEQYDISEDEANARLQLSPLTTWRKVNYRVRSGDTLSRIARRWRISVASIRKDNRLRSSHLQVGQRLSLTVPRVERMPSLTVVTSQANANQPTVVPIIYAVKKGDTLSTIAQRYGVTISALKRTNRIRSNVLKVGQRVRIYKENQPEPTINYYDVKSGDTLSTIAQRYGITVVRLKRANQLTGSHLKIGQRLEIPSPDRLDRKSSTGAPVANAKVETSPQEVGEYTVVSGDSLYNIGKRFGVSVAKLREVNGLRSNALHIGQTLMIPATAKVKPSASKAKVSQPVEAIVKYRVRRGDTLSGIAKRYKTSISELKRLNGLKTNHLKVGQLIQIK